MKKLIITLLILLGIGAVAVVTCPDRQAHKEAIMSVVNESINDELHTDDKDAQALSALFGSIGSSVAGYVIDNRLIVDNHFVYSTGVQKDFDGVDKQVSVGVFGHVFTFGKEDLKKALNGQ